MGKLLDEARFYKANGIVAIPLQPRSKLPLFHWKYWCNKMPRDVELRVWFEDDSGNIGIICGGKDNLVVIDFDNMDGYKWWSDKCYSSHSIVWKNVLESGYKVKTSRGIHVYVKTEERVESKELKCRGIGIRSHNHYVLVPPSLHPSGAQYEKLCEFNVYKVFDLQSFLEVPPVENLQPVELDEIWDCDLILKKEGSVIEAIKAAYPVLNYVSRLTHMERKSYDGRWWYGRCVSPYHEDKNPSFRVDTLNNLCSCMTPSCMLFEERGLDVIALHAKLNGLSNKEAISELNINLETEGVYR